MTAHRLMQRPKSVRPKAGFYKAAVEQHRERGHHPTLFREAAPWFYVHGIDPERVPPGARLVVGGGRVAVDYLLTGATARYHVGMLTVPMCEDLPLPDLFTILHPDHDQKLVGVVT